MFSGGLRPYTLAPLDRGCVNTIVFDLSSQLNCDSPEVPIDLTDKLLYLTAKTVPWDDVGNDSDATFKVTGTIPNPTTEPGRVVFTVSATQSYINPQQYFWDIVATEMDGTNPQRKALGDFYVIAGPNNQQAGGGA